MKVSFDGLRCSLIGAFNDFCKDLKDENVDGNKIFKQMDEYQIKQLADIRAFIGAINCCYDDSCENDMNDLSGMFLEKVYED